MGNKIKLWQVVILVAILVVGGVYLIFPLSLSPVEEPFVFVNQFSEQTFIEGDSIKIQARNYPMSAVFMYELYIDDVPCYRDKEWVDGIYFVGQEGATRCYRAYSVEPIIENKLPSGWHTIKVRWKGGNPTTYYTCDVATSSPEITYMQRVQYMKEPWFEFEKRVFVVPEEVVTPDPLNSDDDDDEDEEDEPPSQPSQGLSWEYYMLGIVGLFVIYILIRRFKK